LLLLRIELRLLVFNEPAQRLDLPGFEQRLCLRQPGYGTSRVTGRYLVDELIKDRSHQPDDAFTLRIYAAARAL